mgnify:CR=1 FL=1
MNSSFAYFMGVLHDAHIICRPSVSQYGFEIEQKNKPYAEYLSTLIADLFKVQLKLEERRRSWGTYWRLRLYSKVVYNNIMLYDFTQLLMKESKSIKRQLIRGFFDAEGSTSNDEVRMFNKDTQLLEHIKKVLVQEFGLHPGKIVVSKDDVYQLPIYAHQEQLQFMKIFKPLHPDKQLS